LTDLRISHIFLLGIEREHSTVLPRNLRKLEIYFDDPRIAPFVKAWETEFFVTGLSHKKASSFPRLQKLTLVADTIPFYRFYPRD
jgi:hypothetical protein